MDPRAFQASHLTFPTKSNIPGLGVLQGPWVDWAERTREGEMHWGKERDEKKKRDGMFITSWMWKVNQHSE